MDVNLTQHMAAPEQGLTDLSGEAREKLLALLDFRILPSQAEILSRAEALADLAEAAGTRSAMIGGALFLMGPLEAALRAKGIEAFYAFSTRESAEETQPDGSVRKVAVFRHLGTVPGVVGGLINEAFDSGYKAGAAE